VHILLHAMFRQLLQCFLPAVMTDFVGVHDSVWRALGARVEPVRRAGDATAVPVVAEDCLFVLPGAAVLGLERARPYFAAYLGAYPDTVASVQHVLQDDRTAAIRSTIAGRNSGSLVTPSGTAQPSGLEVEWDIVEWLVVEDGQIVEWRIYQEPTPYIDALNYLRAQAGGAGLFDGDEDPCVGSVLPEVNRLASPLDRLPGNRAAD
jgi:hypothetical protein